MKSMMNTVANPTREGNVRCKAFSGHGVRLYRVRVSFAVGGVASLTVWDSVAGHFTRCHSISPKAQKRIVRILSRGGYIVE